MRSLLIQSLPGRKEEHLTDRFTWAFRKWEVFAILFMWSFFSGVFLFYCLRWVSPSDSAVQYPILMIMYPEEYPIPYLQIIAIVFAVAGAMWLRYCSRFKSPARLLSVIIALCVTLLIYGFIAVVCWMIHDIEAGFLPSTKTLMFNLKRYEAQAPIIMLFVAVFSVPLSPLAFATGLNILYTVADYSLGNLERTSVARLLLRWVRGVLYAFLPAMILQVFLISAYFFSVGALSLDSGEILVNLWFQFARAATGIPFIVGLGLIAVPFLGWMIWSTRRWNGRVAGQ